MRHAILMTAIVVALSSRSDAADATVGAEVLVRQIRGFEAQLATEGDMAKRQALADKIERCKHELGPRDPSGARVRCQAMWHDGAIESLETEIRHLQARPKGGSPAALALDGRLQTRRVAAACLARGWGLGGKTLKYQFDAYGQYLANNLPLLDDLFDAMGMALARTPPAASTTGGPDRDAFAAAIAQAKDGFAEMDRAADRMVAADLKKEKQAEAALAALGEFTQGLRAVREASAAIRELTDKSKKPEAPAPAPEGLTAADKAALEKVRAAAAALGASDDWKNVREALEHLATVAETGLQIPRARPEAGELLEWLGRAADYATGLASSKAAYPDYKASRQGGLEQAFQDMQNKVLRHRGYATVQRLETADRARAILDAGPLSPEASQGLLRALHMPYKAFDSDETWREFRTGLTTTVDIFGQMQAWPPKDMPRPLLDSYRACANVLRKQAEASGRMATKDTDALASAWGRAGTAARDVQRVVWADEAVRATARYAPGHAGLMYNELSLRISRLPGAFTAETMSARPQLDSLLRPFHEWADLRLPGPEHQRAVMSLTGGTYPAALNALGNAIVQAFGGAARGRSDAIQSVLEAQWIFHVLRHRAVAETGGAAKTPVANLADFSIPEKPWLQFVGTLDKQVRVLIAQFAGERRSKALQTRFLAPWDAIYCAVASAQRAAVRARRPGDTDLDVLMRNLGQASAAAAPDPACFGWAVGYHCTEAATALLAGFTATADWHLEAITYWRNAEGYENQLGAAALDPPK